MKVASRLQLAHAILHTTWRPALLPTTTAESDVAMDISQLICQLGLGTKQVRTVAISWL